MGAPTANDKALLASMSVRNKAIVLESYLVNGDSMAEAGSAINLDGQTASMTASCVMRCYGFHGRNAGCLFKLRDSIKLDDFMAFIRKYPDGTDDSSALFAFMNDRAKKHSKPVLGRELKSESRGTAKEVRNEIPKPNLSSGSSVHDESDYSSSSDEDTPNAFIVVIFFALMIFLTPKCHKFLLGTLGLGKFLSFILCVPLAWFVTLIICCVAVRVFLAMFHR